MSNPHLPPKDIGETDCQAGYTEEAVQKYGELYRQLALDEVIELLKKIEEGYGVTDKGLSSEEYQRMKQTAREHREAIRRLK